MHIIRRETPVRSFIVRWILGRTYLVKETMTLVLKEEPVPVLLPVLKQEEWLITDLVKHPIKEELQAEIVSSRLIKAEVEHVEEEPEMSLFNVKMKDEVPMDDDLYGLGDGDDDPLSIQFSEKIVEPVICNVAQLPLSPLMVEENSKCRNVRSSVASTNVHNNQNISFAQYDRSTLLGYEEVPVCQIKHEETLPPNECEVGNNCNDFNKRFKESIVTVRTLNERNKTELTNKKKYECDTCHKCFSTKDYVIVHLRIHSGERNYKCNECGKCFTESGQLKVHSRIHTGEKSYNCNVCGKCFTQSGSLKLHSIIHTGEKSYKCNECGKCFAQSGSLKRHSRIHTGEKCYKCNECGKCFTQSGQLKVHSTIHTGEKSYKCNECGKCFARSDNLKNHSRIHTGEKSYKCNECGKCFTLSGYLKVHSIIHTGEMNYKCNECGKCFARSGNLKVHSRIHTGEKNYKCNECGKNFAHRISIIRHLRVHSGEH